MAKLPYPLTVELTPEIQAFFEKIIENDWPVLNVNKIMAYSQGTARELIRLGSRLLTKTQLKHRFRELAVLSVARLSGARYEWTQHVPIALQAGLTKQEIRALYRWKESNLFGAEDKTVLMFAEEVFRNHRASVETYQKAASFLDAAALVELTLAVGYWAMIANLINTFEVDIEEDLIPQGGDLWEIEL